MYELKIQHAINHQLGDMVLAASPNLPVETVVIDGVARRVVGIQAQIGESLAYHEIYLQREAPALPAAGDSPLYFTQIRVNLESRFAVITRIDQDPDAEAKVVKVLSRRDAEALDRAAAWIDQNIGEVEGPRVVRIVNYFAMVIVYDLPTHAESLVVAAKVPPFFRAVGPLHAYSQSAFLLELEKETEPQGLWAEPKTT